MPFDRKFIVRHALLSFLSPVLLVLPVHAQSTVSSISPAATKRSDQVFALKRTVPVSEIKDLVTTLRNILGPHASVNIPMGQNTIVVNDTADQLRLAQKIMNDVESAQPSVPAQPASAAFATGMQTAVRPDRYHVAEQTLYLPAAMAAGDESQLAATLRRTGNPAAKTYLLDTQHAIVVSATPDELEGLRAEMSRLVPDWPVSLPKTASPVFPIRQATTPSDAILEQTLYLPSGTSQQNAAEVLVALRNVLDPVAKVYLVMEKDALVITATETQLELARKVMEDLEPNRPEA